MDEEGDKLRPGRTGPAAYPHGDITQTIIGAAIEVHRALGAGFLEKVYEEALLHELKLREVKCGSQIETPVFYKTHRGGSYYCDILVENKVICEIKALDSLTPVHESQLLNYLKATGLKVGLLLNFGTNRLQIKRMVL